MQYFTLPLEEYKTNKIEIGHSVRELWCHIPIDTRKLPLFLRQVLKSTVRIITNHQATLSNIAIQPNKKETLSSKLNNKIKR